MVENSTLNVQMVYRLTLFEEQKNEVYNKYNEL